MAHKLNRDREHRKPERERRTSENSGIDKQLGSVLALSKMYVWLVHTHTHIDSPKDPGVFGVHHIWRRASSPCHHYVFHSYMFSKLGFYLFCSSRLSCQN